MGSLEESNNLFTPCFPPESFRTSAKISDGQKQCFGLLQALRDARLQLRSLKFAYLSAYFLESKPALIKSMQGSLDFLEVLSLSTCIGLSDDPACFSVDVGYFPCLAPRLKCSHIALIQNTPREHVFSISRAFDT